LLLVLRKYKISLLYFVFKQILTHRLGLCLYKLSLFNVCLCSSVLLFTWSFIAFLGTKSLASNDGFIILFTALFHTLLLRDEGGIPRVRVATLRSLLLIHHFIRRRLRSTVSLNDGILPSLYYADFVHIDVADYMRSRELYCFRYCPLALFINICKGNGGVDFKLRITVRMRNSLWREHFRYKT